jgi:hypothetical protein
MEAEETNLRYRHHRAPTDSQRHYFRTKGAWLASTGHRPVFWRIQESTLKAYGWTGSLKVKTLALWHD